MRGALRYVYLMVLGETGADDHNYSKGNQPSNTSILWLFFILFTLIVCVHMLNMLIAIMGESFSQNKESEQVNRIKEHLNFVLYNWALNPIQEDKNNGSTNYLVSAIMKDRNGEDEEMNNICEELREIATKKDVSLELVLQEIQNIRDKMYRRVKIE